MCQTVVLSGMILGFGGCGGGDSTTSSESGDSKSAESAATAAPAAAPGGMEVGAPGGMGMGAPGGMAGGAPGGMAMGAPGGMAGGAPGGMGMGMPGGGSAMMPGGAGYPGGTGAPALSLRPDDFAEWTDQNFEDAVRERDPKVLDAIDARVMAAPGDPKVAELLAGLLIVTSESSTPGAGVTGGGVAAYPGMANPGQGNNLPNYAGPAAGMRNGGGPAGLPSTGSPGNDGSNIKSSAASTVSEAKKLLDLTAIPLLTGAHAPETQTYANLTYSIPGSSINEAFKFHESQLVNTGWTQSQGGIGTLRTFEKDGYTVTLSTSMIRPGIVTVQIDNHGNVDLAKLPMPSGAKQIYVGKDRARFNVSTAVDATKNALLKPLGTKGWQPDGEDKDVLYFRQNAVRLGIKVYPAPNQGVGTLIEITPELLAHDLPASPDATKLK